MEALEMINQTVSAMKTFDKEEYRKAEVLPELFALQQEVVDLTFGSDRPNRENLRLWDVERYFESLNDQRGHVADMELRAFKYGCKDVCSLISGEIAGARGEEKALRSLGTLGTRHRILKNVELEDGEIKSEIDMVVVTTKGIFLVEVKNTKLNVFIDENGIYGKVGKSKCYTSDLGRKTKEREFLVQNALRNAGYEMIRIESITVFTNNAIQVHNRYGGLQTCYLCQLPYIIDEDKGAETFSDADLDAMTEAIECAKSDSTYPVDFDPERFKVSFATLKYALCSDVSEPEQPSGKAEKPLAEESPSRQLESEQLATEPSEEKSFRASAGSSILRVAIAATLSALATAIWKRAA